MPKNPVVVSNFLNICRFKNELKSVGQTFAIIISIYQQNNNIVIKAMVNNTFIFFSEKAYNNASFNFGGYIVKNRFSIQDLRKQDKVFGTYTKSKNNKYHFCKVVFANKLFQISKYIRNKQTFKKHMLLKYIKNPSEEDILFVSLMMNEISPCFELISSKINDTKQVNKMLRFIFKFCLEYKSEIFCNILDVLKNFKIKHEFSNLKVKKKTIHDYYEQQKTQKKMLNDYVFQYII